MTDQPAASPPPSSASRWLMNLLGAGIALAVVLWFFIPLIEWGGSDPPLITERAKWPPAMERLLQGAELPAEDVAAMEVTPQADGYFLRMPATDATVALVEGRFNSIDEANEPRVDEAIGQFWDHLPHRWRSHKPRDGDRFFVGPHGEVARVNNEDRIILIWHGTLRQ